MPPVRTRFKRPTVNRIIDWLSKRQGVFKNGSRRRKEAGFGAKNTSAFTTRLRLRFATTRSRRSQRRRRKSADSTRRRSASLPRRLRFLRRFLNSPCEEVRNPRVPLSFGGRLSAFGFALRFAGHRHETDR